MPSLGIEMGMMRGIQGVIVVRLFPKSPAAVGGVKTGDVIISLDSSEVRDGRELKQILAKKQPGDQVKLGVLRDKDKLELDVTLKSFNELFQEP
jgi:S1-C subfamily serine protease